MNKDWFHIFCQQTLDCLNIWSSEFSISGNLVSFKKLWNFLHFNTESQLLFFYPFSLITSDAVQSSRILSSIASNSLVWLKFMTSYWLFNMKANMHESNVFVYELGKLVQRWQFIVNSKIVFQPRRSHFISSNEVQIQISEQRLIWHSELTKSSTKHIMYCKFIENMNPFRFLTH